MKLGSRFTRPVVPDECGSAGDLALLRVREVGRDHVLVLGEVVERAEIDLVLVDVREGRQHHEPEDQGVSSPPGEADQRRLEEHRARVDGQLLVGASAVAPSVTRRVSVRSPARRHARRASRRVAEEPENDREHRTDRGNEPAEHQAEQETRDPDREADRPEAGPGNVRGVGTVRAQR